MNKIIKVRSKHAKKLTDITYLTGGSFIFETATKFESSIHNWDFFSGMSRSGQTLSGMYGIFSRKKSMMTSPKVEIPYSMRLTHLRISLSRLSC